MRFVPPSGPRAYVLICLGVLLSGVTRGDAQPASSRAGMIRETGQPSAPAGNEIEPPPAPLSTDPSVDDQVDAHVQAATEHFAAGRYAQSVQELTAAHTLDPQPIFLFNIAQSLRRGQRLRDALAYYQRYLSVDPKSSLRAETHGYIQELKVILERQDQLERERRKPAWRKPWFWGLIGGSVALVATGLGLGLGLALQDNRTVIDVKP